MTKLLHAGVYKVGPARRVPRSRIWLQGKHLTAAGFKPGDRIGCTWYGDRLTIDHNPEPKGYEMRTVSGKGDVPIVDITGARVRDTFTAGHVEVSFYPGRIVIREAQ